MKKRWVWCTKHGKHKENGPIVQLEIKDIHLKTFSFIVIELKQEKLRMFWNYQRAINLHTHTHRFKVTSLTLNRFVSSAFICFSCTRVLLSLLLSHLYFYDRAQRCPIRGDFISMSHLICVFAFKFTLSCSVISIFISHGFLFYCHVIHQCFSRFTDVIIQFCLYLILKKIISSFIFKIKSTQSEQ